MARRVPRCYADQQFRAVMRRFFDDWVEEFQNVERSLGGT